jgi:hypothetical protein
MMSLPPDLDRLGEQLARAAGSTLAARRARRERRWRVAITAVVGALAFATLTPAALGPAVREIANTRLAAFTAPPPGCEHLRGEGYLMARCDAGKATVSHRPYAWR